MDEPRPETEEQADEPFGHDKPDEVLTIFVKLVNRVPGAGMGVTLFVRGAIVSGTLVGGAAFFEGLAESADNAFRGTTGEEPSGEGLGAVFREVASETYGENADWERRPTGHLHLRDAQVFHPGAVPMPAGGTRWRGRLSSVDGWMLGTLDIAPGWPDDDDEPEPYP